VVSELFRREALDNRRERLLGDVVLTQPPSFWLWSGFAGVAVLLIVLMLVLGTYSRRENVAGFVRPDKGLIKVFAPQSGLLDTLHVEEGERIEAGALLFTVSTGRSGAAPEDVDALIVEKLAAAREALKARRVERSELDSLEQGRLRERFSRLALEIDELERLVDIQAGRFDASDRQVARLAELGAGGFVSEADLIIARDGRANIELDLLEASRRLAEKRGELLDAGKLIEQLPLRSSLDLAEIDQQLSTIDQRILETGGRRSYTLRAPSAGRVTALQVTAGQRVREERPLLTILPDDTRFRADLFVPTRAIGFIESGQSVLLRYGAFPYQQFGLYEGTVDKVAETVLLPAELDVPVPVDEPVYRVSVRLDRQTVSAYGREFDLRAGMLLEASILLEGRSLGEWLLAPIYSLRGAL